jgi:hypothetical protein
LRLLIAAVWPAAVAAAAVEREHARVVLSTGAKIGGSWTLVHPSASRPGHLPTGQGDPTPGAPRAEVVAQPASSTGVLIGYARCSTDKQDLAAQRQTLRQLGVTDDRVYLDHGMTGRNRWRPGLQQAQAAVREGDTLVVPKLDRLA